MRSKAEAQKALDELQAEHAAAHAASTVSGILGSLDTGKLLLILKFILDNLPVKK